MRALFGPSFTIALLAVALLPASTAAQVAGREPGPGQPAPGGTTFVDTQNPVTESGRLRLWQAYSTNGGRVMLKVFRPEGSRLVLVGASGLEAVPAGQVATFACWIRVSKNDLIGCFCPDDTCLDRFPDGSALSVAGDSGTRDLDELSTVVGSPALYAGSSDAVDIPSTASSDLVLPVAARTPGLHGTWWTTSLEIFNTASEETTVALYFNLSDHDNTTPAGSAQVLLPARATRTFDDLLVTVFGLESATGSVDVVASAPVIAHARIFTQAEGGGTYGQLVPAVPARWAVGDDHAPGLNPSSDLVYLFELREDEAYRTNVGVVNVSGVPLAVELQAYDGAKAMGQPLRLELPPFSHTQVNHVLLALSMPAGTTGVRVNVEAVAGSSGRFLAYASRVDNRTGDAVFLPGSREPALAE